MGFWGGIGSILGWIIAGIIFGLLAKAVLPGRQPIPWWATILSGIVGAFIGNAVAAWGGYTNANGGLPWFRWVLDIIGAVVVVAIVTALWRKRTGKTEDAEAARR